ncbi:RidA family protein [Mycobacterium sp. AZCC_0083]|uniref:RidA family protein n=1 Tax=Mycobacterium sp. AZCC_0083 TaxID=2735882 RepID=UPI001609CFED|nr:RidA family protein [Mycobacterium sp. AZCC_0083]MBB5164869.1 enamine deaminase RidA (YjgF/YER057c/UK114 family) [Mycobacterium sp. AZCC_0083]
MSTDHDLPPAPQGDYATAVVHAGIAYSAGMTPRRDGRLTVTGVVGSTVSVAQAWAAARLAAANAVAAVRAALPGDATVRCLRMSVYVACAPEFHDLSTVADGASDAIVTILGPQALPARSAIGVQSLPSGAPVEVELMATAVSN